MALPPPSVARQPIHRRVVHVEAFRRDDGLFDIEARLTDTKPYPVDLVTGPRAAGEPIHDMMVRITIDASYTIVAAETDSMRVPVPGTCDRLGDRYRQLVGLNLLRDFRKAVHARLGRTAGCTHLTELTAVLPTAALQSISHFVNPPEQNPSEPPFFLGQCHAYDRSGEVVRRYYPQWFIQAE